MEVLSENNKSINWKDKLVPLDRTGYFDGKIKIRIEFDLNEINLIQKTEPEATEKQRIRVAILKAFGGKDERIKKVAKADITAINENVNFQKFIDYGLTLKKSGIAIDIMRQRLKKAGHDIINQDVILKAVYPKAFKNKELF